MSDRDQSPLGRSVGYPERYDPAQLHAIERRHGRRLLGIDPDAPPFSGEDIWTAYEISWLNPSGKPDVACAEFRFRASSPRLVESKSLKLYLNSFNQTRFDDAEAVRSAIERDLSGACGEQVLVSLYGPPQWGEHLAPQALDGDCLDDLDVDVEHYRPEPALLSADDGAPVEEALYSHLLRSRCPVTGQPDWGSVSVTYRGPRIEREALLKYLVSFREHDEFHEQCVERIFVDVLERCRPQFLTVQARYLRRGGLDINPVRTSGDEAVHWHRTFRQ